MKNLSPGEIPLFMPRSNTSTAVNKTGSWRFFHPKYEEKTAPCSAACPAGQDIPRIEMLASWGLLKSAWQKIVLENPFPSVCGRVCFHPCESKCNRSNLDEPIAIHRLERFLGDTAISKGRKPDLNLKATNGKKIAIAGSGPAGLAAAYFMRRLGYSCDVYEAWPEPGGLLRWGIPNYRLPRAILKNEIKHIEDLGVTIQCNTPVTENVLQKLYREYDALFIGCGYGRPISMKIDGGNLAYDGLEFLRNVQQDNTSTLTGTAAIVGGGNTAIDVARSLARLGATPLIVYRRRIQDMPAFAPEVEMAIREGIAIKELVSPIRIQKNRSDDSDSPRYILTLRKMKVSKKAIRGRARVIPDGEKTEIIKVQRIFSAIGAEAQALWQRSAAEETRSVTLSHCQIIENKIPLLFGGDLTAPVKSVTDAIASGKQAAIALDTYFDTNLGAVKERIAACQVGSGPALSMETYLNDVQPNKNAHVVTYDEINIDYFQTESRVNPSFLDAKKSTRSFAEIETTLENHAAKQEARRCFNCGSCNACDYCRFYCPEMAVIVEKAERHINMDYCKGCGVCATECPRNAMALEEEIK